MTFSPSKRLLIKGILASCLLSISRVGFAATQVLAVRTWPSETYTRITIESNNALTYTQSILKDPERLVIDIDQLTLNATFQALAQQVQRSDPFIKQIRIAQNTPTKVRLVVDLKQKTNPASFTLKPIAEYKHRLVIDLYPAINDPLLVMLEKINDNVVPASAPETTKTPTKTAATKNPTNENSKMAVVMIDPGHGGEDPGAIGLKKTKEKDIVLKIGRRLRDLLKEEKNIKVYMTRDADISLPLSVRVAKARKVKADLFISIHADAFTKRTARGSSVFALSTRGASSAEAKFLAQTQNEADLIGGIDSKKYSEEINKITLNMTTTKNQEFSVLLGKLVLEQMKKINTLHKNQIETAGFAVLKSPDVPSVLVETAFISNVEEEQKLRTNAFQNKVAHALRLGIKNYLAKRKR